MTKYNEIEIANLIANQKDEEKKYWSELLSDIRGKSNFLSDYQDNSGFHKKVLSYKISEKTFHDISKLSNNSDLLLFIILASGLASILQRYTNNEDIIIGMPTFSELKGDKFLSKYIPLRFTISDDISFKDILVKTKTQINNSIKNCYFPIEVLIENLGIDSNHKSPFFDVAILLEDLMNLDNISPLQNNIVFSFKKRNNFIELSIIYNDKIYCETTLNHIFNQYETLLSKALVNIDKPVNKISLISEIEKNKLLNELNNTEGISSNVSIDKFIEEYAQNSPDAIAVVFNDQKITYKELNFLAGILAFQLQHQKIKKGEVIAIIIDHSIEMIIGILGIMKAGCCYMPIDPSYPETRIQIMLNDSKASLVITNSKAIKNFSFQSLQGTVNIDVNVVYTGTRDQINNLDLLPYPDRSLIDYEKYNHYLGQAAVKDSMSILATRGCPFKCYYCHKIWPKKHVYRSAENIFEEIKMLYQIGVKRFAIIDDIFNFNKQNSRLLFELIINNKLKVQLFFPNGIRADLLTEDYVDLMINAGTVNIAFALETASNRLQKEIKKNVDLERFKSILEYTSVKYPHVITELFTMIGFPSETKEEAMKTLNFIYNIKWVHFPYVYVLKIFRNTDMEKFALENGISQEQIMNSQSLAFHELPETLPFEKEFVIRYQSEFMKNYFLLKERLKNVLPYQLRILSEDELVKKYKSYLPVKINCLEDVLSELGISKDEIDYKNRNTEEFFVPDLNKKLKLAFKEKISAINSLKILLLDLSQNFSDNNYLLDNLIEPPLGLMYLLTTLNERLGEKINGKIAKSFIDFNSIKELNDIIENFKPDIIGIRSLSLYKRMCHETIAHIKLKNPEIPVIIGGPYSTSSYLEALADKNIDLAIIGEGEETLFELIQSMLQNNNKLPDNEKLKQIKGISFIPDIDKDKQSDFRKVIVFDNPYEDFKIDVNKSFSSHNSSGDLAYLMYTSGSTGKPKGSFVKHESIIRVTKQPNYINITPKDSLLQLSNYTFDGSIFDIFGSLINGAKLVIINKEDITNPKKLEETIINENVTILFMTTALFNAFSAVAKLSLKNIKKILFGGERVSVTHTLDMLNKVGTDKIIHVYGPTETTVFSTYFNVNTVEQHAKTLPIGKPITNTSVYILDKFKNPVPFGIPGEIFIGGIGVSNGYLNNPELTHKKFIKNPVNVCEVVYSTGDIGRWINDNNIEFCGRIDQQVKINGFRIELGEIEQIIKKYSNITDALVTTSANSNDQLEIVAYYISDIVIDIHSLNSHLKKMLPYFMVPKHYFKIETFPLTSNNKINYQLLPKPYESIIDNFLAPENELEKTLASMWSEVLGIEKGKISVNSNFFELGGHSINVIHIFAKIEKAGLKSSINNLFLYPTIKELAKQLMIENECVNLNLQDKNEHNELLKNKYGDNCFLEKYFDSGKEYSVLFIPEEQENNLDKIIQFFENNIAKEHQPHYVLKASDKRMILNKDGQVNFENLIKRAL